MLLMALGSSTSAAIDDEREKEARLARVNDPLWAFIMDLKLEWLPLRREEKPGDDSAGGRRAFAVSDLPVGTAMAVVVAVVDAKPEEPGPGEWKFCSKVRIEELAVVVAIAVREEAVVRVDGLKWSMGDWKLSDSLT